MNLVFGLGHLYISKVKNGNTNIWELIYVLEYNY